MPLDLVGTVRDITVMDMVHMEMARMIERYWWLAPLFSSPLVRPLCLYIILLLFVLLASDLCLSHMYPIIECLIDA